MEKVVQGEDKAKQAALLKAAEVYMQGGTYEEVRASGGNEV